MPVSSIHQAAPMANLNIVNVNEQNKESEISAQKKYKIELQAEISKLRSKYQDYSKPVKKEPEENLKKSLINQQLPTQNHSNARAANGTF